MKLRILALGIFMAAFTTASAQNYSFETVNKETFVFTDANIKDMHLRVKNNTASTIGITWKMYQTVDTTKWGSFAFCDPSLCYFNVEAGVEYMTEIAGRDTGDFKLSLMAKPGAGLDTYAITFYETGNNSVVDTLTFSLDARALGIVTGSGQAKNVSVYPNPAVNTLNLDIPGTKRITVYDMQGQEVIREIISGTTISTLALKPGMYTLQAVSGNEVYRAKFLKN